MADITHIKYLRKISQDKNPVLGGNLDVGSNLIMFDEYNNGNSGVSKTIDWNNGQKQKITLTDNCEFTFVNPSKSCNLVLIIIMGGTGSYTITWPDTVYTPSGTAPTITAAVGSEDFAGLYFNGTKYDVIVSNDFQVISLAGLGSTQSNKINFKPIKQNMPIFKKASIKERIKKFFKKLLKK